MKRITYVSRTAGPLAQSTLDEIATLSIKNNARSNVTGILLLAGEFFLQILEGEENDVDQTLERIRMDPRHSELQVLKVERDAVHRQFPDWSMRTV